jgi:voltage-gated potassium channel
MDIDIVDPPHVRRYHRFFVRHHLYTLLLFLTVLTLVAGLSVYLIETSHPGGNFKTAFDGIWWAFTTVSSVGYGDLYPVTVPGRLIAKVLIIAGVSTFFAMVSIIVAYIVGKDETEHYRAISARIHTLEQKIDRLTATLAEAKVEPDTQAPSSPAKKAVRTP